MALLPLLKTMSKTASRSLPMIKRGLREGLSNRAITEGLQAAGLSPGRAAVNKIVRELKGIETTTADLRFLKRDARPNPARLKEALTPIARNYSFTLRARGINPHTLLPEEKFVTVSSDTLLSRGEMEDIVMENFVGREGSIPLNEVELQVEESVKRADL